MCIESTLTSPKNVFKPIFLLLSTFISVTHTSKIILVDKNTFTPLHHSKKKKALRRHGIEILRERERDGPLKTNLWIDGPHPPSKFDVCKCH